MEQKQYIKKRFSKSNEADLWKEMYQNPTSAFHYHMVLRRNHAFQKVSQQPTGNKILDLGCGAGPLLGPLNDSSFDVIGMDISYDMLINATKSSENTQIPPLVLQGNSEALPFPDSHFDVVVSLGMFGYVENVTGALDEIRRILKPGGLFIFSVRNRFHQILFDPCKFLNFTFKKATSLIKKPLSPLIKRPTINDNNSKNIANSERGFLIDIFDNPHKVIQTVEKRGFIFDAFEGLGYGPFSLCEHDILSGNGSILTSKAIESFLRLTRLHHFSKWTSDVSVYSFNATK